MSDKINPFTVSGSTAGVKYSYSIDPKNWTAETVQFLVEYAAGVIVNRCTASMKDSKESEREEKRLATVAKIVSGKLEGRISSTQFTAEQDLILEYIKAGKFVWPKEKTGKLTPKGKPQTKPAEWNEGWHEYCKWYAADKGKEYSPEVDEKLYPIILGFAKKHQEDLIEAARKAREREAKEKALEGIW